MPTWLLEIASRGHKQPPGAFADMMPSGLDGTPINLFLNDACLEFQQSKEKKLHRPEMAQWLGCEANTGESRSSFSLAPSDTIRRKKESTEFELTGGGRQHRIAVARVGEHESFSRKPLVITTLPRLHSGPDDLCMSLQSVHGGNIKVQ